MGDELRNDLILFVLTLGVGIISWFMKGLHDDVKTLIAGDIDKVRKDQHNELAKSLREADNALSRELSDLRGELRGKGVLRGGD